MLCLVWFQLLLSFECTSQQCFHLLQKHKHKYLINVICTDGAHCTAHSHRKYVFLFSHFFSFVVLLRVSLPFRCKTFPLKFLILIFFNYFSSNGRFFLSQAYRWFRVYISRWMSVGKKSVKVLHSLVAFAVAWYIYIYIFVSFCFYFCSFSLCVFLSFEKSCLFSSFSLDNFLVTCPFPFLRIICKYFPTANFSAANQINENTMQSICKVKWMHACEPTFNRMHARSDQFWSVFCFNFPSFEIFLLITSTYSGSNASYSRFSVWMEKHENRMNKSIESKRKRKICVLFMVNGCHLFESRISSFVCWCLNMVLKTNEIQSIRRFKLVLCLALHIRWKLLSFGLGTQMLNQLHTKVKKVKRK